ncbi:MAG: short-chain dehydrogenase [Leptothrix sp. (in: Bacteria)]|nr:short-chain dehydrogenase [Leptothrix sp. (in: b-proteobacteria)]
MGEARCRSAHRRVVVSAPPLVFVTGASSGIGQALAARYAAAGWRLAVVARRREALQAWAAAQGLGPDRCEAYAADVAVPDSIIAAGQACVASQGLPDVVIACAGVSVGMDTAERGDLAVMRDMFALNNLGLAATFHPFLQGMRERGSGRLVGVASVSAIRGLPGHGAYCASKAGVVAYCESLRVECRGAGVQVVTLLPGYVATPLTASNPYRMPFLMVPEAFAERAFRAIQAGRSYVVIPWQMGVVAKLLRLLPNALFDRLMARRGRKPRRV